MTQQFSNCLLIMNLSDYNRHKMKTLFVTDEEIWNSQHWLIVYFRVHCCGPYTKV